MCIRNNSFKSCSALHKRVKLPKRDSFKTKNKKTFVHVSISRCTSSADGALTCYRS